RRLTPRPQLARPDPVGVGSALSLLVQESFAVGGSAGLLSLLVIFGSLLLVAGWEFCRPRRRRGFPALQRRFGNLGIWVFNIVLAAFIFARPDTFRLYLEATFGLALPVWPIAKNGWVSFVAAFLLLDFLNYALHRCQHAVPFLWRFHALHHSDPDV